MIYISKGSWNDAEQACDSIGAKLWAINSFAEWLHLSSSFGKVAIDTKQNRDMNVDLIKMSSTVILFIGQQLYSQVIILKRIFTIVNPNAYCNLILNICFRIHGSTKRHIYMTTTGHCI